MGSRLNWRGFANNFGNDAHVILVSEPRGLVEAVLQERDSSGGGRLPQHWPAVHQASQTCMCLTGHVAWHPSHVVHALTYVIDVL